MPNKPAHTGTTQRQNQACYAKVAILSNSAFSDDPFPSPQIYLFRPLRYHTACLFIPDGIPIMSDWSLPDFERKICPPEELAQRLHELPRPLVFTNGCFDILHRGHVSYLAQARALGASLLLALNTDASVRRLGKGSDRPINPLADRAAVVAALQSVNAVTWFDEDTPAALIAQVRPDVLVKGGDWQPENIVGASETLARGGSVHSIPFLHQTSTTQTLAKIRRTERQ